MNHLLQCRSMRQRFALVVLALFLTGSFGCPGGGSGPVLNPVAVTITPVNASLPPGGIQTFSAGVTNTSNTRVTWSVQEGAPGGTITSAGVYTASTTAGVYHVIATSAADSTKSATVPVTVHVVVTVAPASATLTLGQMQAFTATVVGTSNQGVAWSVAEGAAGGSVDPTGHYTAALQPGTYHVMATSQVDTNQSGACTIIVSSGSASGTIQ